jgi:UDP-glucose 4-epimerase
MERVLITGVAGFIGSHVASRFIREGYEVIGVDDLSTGRQENVPPGLTFIQGNLASRSTMAKIPSKCRKILHIAGQSSGEISFDDPVSDLEKNTASTLNLIRYGIENGVERFIYASSMSVYGSVGNEPIDENKVAAPLSCYGVSKLAAEGYLRVYSEQLPYVVLRMFNVYGPGQDMNNLRQGMVSIYVAQALRDGRIKVNGSIDRFRDFIYIDDIIETWYRAACYPAAIRKTLNVGTGVKTSIATLLRQVSKIVPGSEYYISSGTPGDQNGIYADTTRLRDCLEINSFIPIDIGLKKFVDWAREEKSKKNII